MTLSQKILVKGLNTDLKTGDRIGVSEIMDIEKKLFLYAIEPYNWPCVIAWKRLENVSVSLADR